MLRQPFENLYRFLIARLIQRFLEMMHLEQLKCFWSKKVVRFLSCLMATFCIIFFSNSTFATVSDIPLVLASLAKANTLVILDNSNSMDEAPNGSAVGSFSSESKSEIARSIIRQLLTDYQDKTNLGLMSYKLASTSSYRIHNSPYDASYDPGNYNPAFTGNRSSTTKKYMVTVVNGTNNTNVYYNVALPFYASSTQGTQFCYSTTANAAASAAHPDGFHNNETTAGPWDTYNCYKKKAGTSDAAPPGGGYSTSGYNGQLNPTDSDYAQGIFDFGTRLVWYDVGPTWFANASPGRGYLHTPIKLLNSTQVTALTAKLKCNVPSPGTAPGTACATTGIQNAGLTPIEGTLLTAKDYFSGAWNTTSEGYTASTYPLPESCGKNFTILLTDGLPSTNKNGTILSNPTTAITEAAAAAATLYAAGVETYVVGFALPYGTDPNTLNTIATAGGTGAAYLASDQATLTAALNTIFLDIESKVSSTTSLATNSTRLETGTVIYQAKFNSTDWSGRVLAYTLTANGTIYDPDGDGNIEEDALWDTDTAGKIPAHGSRKIYTWNGTQGIEFKVSTWSSLDASQQTALISTGTLTDGQNRLNWIRGDQSNEKPSGTLRKRTKLLGDIVDSDPLYVDATKSQYVGATKMLYVGANDGMLHAFDATTGVEKFAFVPKAVFSRFANLTSPSYAHQFFVDGSPQVGDANGKAILLGTTGAGGRSVFALDVSNPDSFDASKVLWEYTDTDLGYTIGQPSIGRLQNGTWVAILGNGYQSDNSRAFLYVINLATGALIAKINTGAGSAATPNGLATPTLLVDPDDTNKSVVAAYAGDLLGNLWKFDLTGSLSSTTTPAFSGAPLFKARDLDGNIQPITAPPAISVHPRASDATQPRHGYMVFFGTGKYFEVGDHAAIASPVQSLYGIWDTSVLNSGTWTSGTAITATDRSVLQQQEILSETTAVGNEFRVLSKNPIDWDTKRGWYLDLMVGNTRVGERVTDQATLYSGRAIFITRIPVLPSNICDTATGDSWIMSVSMETGGRLLDSTGADKVILDVNRDGSFNEYDNIITGIAGEPATGSAVSGFKTELAGLSSGFTLIENANKFDVLVSGIDALTTTASASAASTGSNITAQTKAIAAAAVAKAATAAVAAGGDAAAVVAAVTNAVAAAITSAVNTTGGSTSDASAAANAVVAAVTAAQASGASELAIAIAATQAAGLLQGTSGVGVGMALDSTITPSRQSWRQLR